MSETEHSSWWTQTILCRFDFFRLHWQSPAIPMNKFHGNCIDRGFYQKQNGFAAVLVWDPGSECHSEGFDKHRSLQCHHFLKWICGIFNSVELIDCLWWSWLGNLRHPSQRDFNHINDLYLLLNSLMVRSVALLCSDIIVHTHTGSWYFCVNWLID